MLPLAWGDRGTRSPSVCCGKRKPLTTLQTSPHPRRFLDWRGGDGEALADPLFGGVPSALVCSVDFPSSSGTAGGRQSVCGRPSGADRVGGCFPGCSLKAALGLRSAEVQLDSHRRSLRPSRTCVFYQPRPQIFGGHGHPESRAHPKHCRLQPVSEGHAYEDGFPQLGAWARCPLVPDVSPGGTGCPTGTLKKGRSVVRSQVCRLGLATLLLPDGLLLRPRSRHMETPGWGPSASPLPTKAWGRQTPREQKSVRLEWQHCWSPGSQGPAHSSITPGAGGSRRSLCSRGATIRARGPPSFSVSPRAAASVSRPRALSPDQPRCRALTPLSHRPRAWALPLACFVHF